MTSSLARTLDRNVALPYVLVFVVVLAVFAVAVHSAVYLLNARDAATRLDALARAAVAVTETDHGGISVSEGAQQLIKDAEGIAWFDLAGRTIASQGIVPPLRGPLRPERSRLVWRGQAFETESVALLARGRVAGYARASISDEQRERSMRWIDLGLAIGFVFAAAGSAAGGWYLSRRSVARITENMRALEAFTANAAHELRTPLAAIRANAEASLRGGELNGKDRARLDTIVATTDAMRALSEDLLTLAQPAALSSAELQRVDLDEIVSGASEAAYAAAAARGLHIDVTCVRPAAEVFANPPQIARVAANLVENAVRYSRDGGTIRIRTWGDRTGGHLVVSDDGIGMTPGELEHIFERFWRADTARRAGDGWGLGLSIVRSIVNRHGGSITVESAPGVGSTFSVFLPRVPPQS